MLHQAIEDRIQSQVIHPQGEILYFFALYLGQEKHVKPLSCAFVKELLECLKMPFQLSFQKGKLENILRSYFEILSNFFLTHSKKPISQERTF